MTTDVRLRTLLAACVLGCMGSRAHAQITIRTQEPVVVRASSMPDFGGADITKVLLYRRTATGWALIPSQIDEFTNDVLQGYYSGGCAQISDVCERAAKLSGEVGDGFNGTDELAFMARDSGISTTPYDWLPQDVASYRYKITLHDPVGEEYGTVYAYIWTSPSPPSSPADYASWATDSSNSQCIGQLASPTFVDPACGWLRSTAQGSQSGLPSFNLFQAGDWTTAALCVKPYSTDASCTVSDSTKNLLDQFKFRTEGPPEKERDWDQACRAFIGVKDGPVRVVRRIMGANSGRFTTMTEYFYGTWLDQLVNIRVHPIVSVTLWLDHRPKNYPQQETPSLVFTGKHSATADHLAMDTMDAVTASADGDYPDWVQVDTSRGTYVQLLTEKRKIPDSLGSFTYEDTQTGGGEQYLPFQFGQHGFKLSGVPSCFGSTIDTICPTNPETSTSLNYGSFIRSWVPLAVDSPTGSPTPAYRSEEGELYSAYQASPIIVGVVREDQATASPPVGHCTPSLSGSVDAGGFSNSMTVSTSSCPVQDATGVQIFRGTVQGVYTLFEDLGKRTTLVDHKVKSGVSYRYIARAYNALGELGNSSAELVLNTVDTVAPPVPVGLSAIAGSHKAIISWAPPDDPDTNSVIVHLATSQNGPYSALNLADPVFCSTASFAVVGLTAGQTYWFRVTAKDSHGNESTYSGEVSAVPTN